MRGGPRRQIHGPRSTVLAAAAFFVGTSPTLAQSPPESIAGRLVTAINSEQHQSETVKKPVRLVGTASARNGLVVYLNDAENRGKQYFCLRRNEGGIACTFGSTPFGGQGLHNLR
jgi:hypothetical protein